MTDQVTDQVAEQDDRRVRVYTDKPVNLAQLADEVGAALNGDAYTAKDGDGLVMVCDPDTDVTEDDLRAAIDAHVPVWPPTRAERTAQIVDAAPDWQTAMKELAAEGLLG